MQEHLFKKFKLGIRWNTLESLVYQGLFCLHQILLYNACTPTLYGSVGVFFSLIYLTIGLSNLGLNTTIAPFIKYASHSRNSFNTVFGQYAPTQLCIIIGAALIAGFCSPYLLPSNTHITPTALSLLTIFLTLSESFKRIGRTLLQSAFYNQVTTLVQVASISSYFIIIWSYHSTFKNPFTFVSIVIPWVVISLVSTTTLLFFCVSWYRNLAVVTQDEEDFYGLQQRSYSARCSNALLGLIGQLFSRNAMVTLCTLQCGVESVAAIKIISYILYSVISIFRNIFQKPSAALLGWSKGSKKEELRVFNYILHTISYHPISYLLLFFGAFYYVGYMSIHNQQSFSFTTAVILLMLCVVENIQIMYESFFLNKERTDLLIILYSVALLFCGILLLSIDSINQITFLTIILCARLFSCLVTGLLSAYLWNIVPFSAKKIKQTLQPK